MMAVMIPMMKDNVIENVTSKLPEADKPKAEEYVSRAEEHFLTVTKRREIPSTAFWLWVDLSIAFYNDFTAEGSSGNVTSVKRGDTTISYSENSASLTNVQTLDNKLKSYKVVLAR